MVEGLPVSTNFEQVEQNRYVLTDPVPNGSSLRRVGFFLSTVPAPIPDDGVAALYASMFPFEEWRFVGSLSNAEPSKIFNVAWRDCDIADQPPEAPCQLAVAIEPAAAVQAGVGEHQVTLQEEFGKKIGEDLFNFMESFNHGVGTAIFERWFQKLQFKLRHSPDWVRYRFS